eukprot:CAMPEP_0118669700 /NCGR_PEP_ID=MMETSP0785-20121206/21046_1 /TAXON_ID=91992 /ORGANISM="Bolidomonas pacifica, Strain CCMP 1866" /LENGTH=67 /DNA_ID=CAMNT_0006564411 /DNA_START=81 /DNA_END=281 /DNA_ORIENTATION=+
MTDRVKPIEILMLTEEYGKRSRLTFTYPLRSLHLSPSPLNTNTTTNPTIVPFREHSDSSIYSKLKES